MQYGIDLRKCDMSYSQFAEYLGSLSKDTPFGYILWLRRTPSADLSKKEKEQKVKYAIKDHDMTKTRNQDHERGMFNALYQIALANKKK